MKIVITGASTYGVDNMGDDGMLATLVQGLRNHCKNPKITFLARHVDKNYDDIFGFHSIKNLDHDNKKQSEGRFFLGMNKGDKIENLHLIKEKIDKADLLIIGGNSFMEISKNNFLRGVSSYSATLATLAKFCNTPYALYGVNVVDKIKSDVTIQHAKFLCENATSVTMREKSGKNYLLDLGISGKNIHVLGDPVFGMKVVKNNQRVNTIIKNNKINLFNKPTIGVGFRHEYWKGSETQRFDVNLQLARLLDEISDKLDCQFMFIPNCTYIHGHKWQDDRITHRDIIKRMKNKKIAFNIEERLSVYDTFRLFNLLDIHISNRRHSCIFAAMNNVPFLTINVSFKGHLIPLLKELNVPNQLASLDDMKNLKNKILKTWKNKDKLSKSLKPKVGKLNKLSQKHVSTIIKNI
jgi:polysaccharide pyruvyl transferase WcaK-like protein